MPDGEGQHEKTNGIVCFIQGISIWGTSRMALNMEKESNTTQMEINILATSSMVYLKDLALIIGPKVRFIEEISNKVSEMDTESGARLKGGNTTKAITCSTANMDMGYTTGPTGMYTRETLSMIRDVEKVSYILMDKWSIVDFGSMDRDVMRRTIRLKGNQ